MLLDLSLTVDIYYFLSISRRIFLVCTVTIVFDVVLHVVVDVAVVLVLIVKCHIVKDSFPTFFFINYPVFSEHVYMRPEGNSNRSEISNRFEMSFRLHGNLHRDFTVASFQTIARPFAHVQMISFN